MDSCVVSEVKNKTVLHAYQMKISRELIPHTYIYNLAKWYGNILNRLKEPFCLNQHNDDRDWLRIQSQITKLFTLFPWYPARFSIPQRTRGLLWFPRERSTTEQQLFTTN